MQGLLRSLGIVHARIELHLLNKPHSAFVNQIFFHVLPNRTTFPALSRSVNKNIFNTSTMDEFLEFDDVDPLAGMDSLTSSLTECVLVSEMTTQ